LRFFVGSDDAGEQRRQWDEYQHYLRTVANGLAPGAAAFAAAPWHYDPTDHRCPHDAWVESLTILEVAQGANAGERSLELHARLLGAYHDGHIDLRYRGVRSYSLVALAEASWLPTRQGIGHGDWLVDEVRLSAHGMVEHEIAFERGSWLIECAELEYQWTSDAGV
jgi:hypothetical protein